ncbi:hypothetical protein [Mucilaginibacter boryungensis]|uniref:DKNYY family protein n=1 Tax=Mucilaginibacter boryungensis TaxID=768480 RepID=A0ABR9XIA3_9SPHI|nr:hypothetical protein [Mucilaginibacter boryungensis]MBE9666950.1 hypothetical protein [Mucilaginibacter boryungensis]
MNRVLQLLCCILCSQTVFSQTNAKVFKATELKNPQLTTVEAKKNFTRYDFSPLWIKTENKFVYGFIGDNYQRIRIKFLKVTKDSAGNYRVYGKSMVKNKLFDFKGTLKITHIRKYKHISEGLDKEYKRKGITGEYTMLGDYTFVEQLTQLPIGTFRGTFKTDFYLTRDNKIHYDDIEQVSDSYTNNNFVGTWTSYDGKITKTCNWGDYRAPNSGDLDTGAGEFSPADKYLPMGWQTVHDAYQNGRNSARAQKEENKEWWE